MPFIEHEPSLCVSVVAEEGSLLSSRIKEKKGINVETNRPTINWLITIRVCVLLHPQSFWHLCYFVQAISRCLFLQTFFE